MDWKHLLAYVTETVEQELLCAEILRARPHDYFAHTGALDFNVVWLMAHGYASVRRERKSSRSSIRPVRMRVLTVPRGCPSVAAISVWLKPA